MRLTIMDFLVKYALERQRRVIFYPPDIVRCIMKTDKLTDADCFDILRYIALNKNNKGLVFYVSKA